MTVGEARREDESNVEADAEKSGQFKVESLKATDVLDTELFGEKKTEEVTVDGGKKSDVMKTEVPGIESEEVTVIQAEMKVPVGVHSNGNDENSDGKDEKKCDLTGGKDSGSGRVEGNLDVNWVPCG